MSYFLQNWAIFLLLMIMTEPFYEETMRLSLGIWSGVKKMDTNAKSSMPGLQSCLYFGPSCSANLYQRNSEKKWLGSKFLVIFGFDKLYSKRILQRMPLPKKNGQFFLLHQTLASRYLYLSMYLQKFFMFQEELLSSILSGKMYKTCGKPSFTLKK